MVLHALFGSDSWRFSAMLACFTFIYKFLLNALPLLPVPDSLSILRSARQNRLRRLEQDLESGSSLPTAPGSGFSTGQHSPLMMQTKAKRERDLQMKATEHSEQAKKERRGSHLSMESKVMYSRLDGARWHAFVAGAVAGLSVLFEKKSRRITIAQQLFVR